MPLDFPNPADSTTYTDPTSGNTYTFANGSWSISNVLSATKGGTGFASYNRGDILFGNASGTLSKLTAGTSGYVLSTNGSGADPTWVAMSSGGGAGTVATPGAQYQLAGYYTGSGASVSGSSTFTNNTATGVVSITHSTGSTSPSFGALLVSGGVGIAGTLSYYKSQIGVAGTSNIPSMAFIGNTNNPVYLNVLENNALSFEGYHGQLLSISPDLTSGYIFSVGDISGIPLLRANANANITANEFGGNFGIGTTNPGYKLEVSGQTAITGSTSSTSTSTGALIVTGGVGVGGSLNVGNTIKFSSGTNGLVFQQASGASLGAIYSTNVTPSTSNYSFATDGNNLNLNSTSNIYFNISNTVKATLSVNQLNIGINVASTTTSSGALVVSGGVGIGGSLNVNNLSKFSNTIEIRSGNELRLYNASDTNYTALDSANVSGNKTFILPSDYGSTGQFLTATNNTGTLGWSTDPIQVNSGLINQVAYYSSAGSSVSGSSTFTNNTSTNTVSITHTTGSGSTTSGALVVSGGVGIGGSLYVGNGNASTGFSTGDLVVFGGVGVSGALRIGDTTVSSSTTTGALTVRGGVGIGGTLYVGSGIAAVSTTSGDVVVTGGVGIGGSLRIGDSTATGSVASGALVVSGGVGVGGGIYVQSTSQFSGNLTIQGSLTMNAPLQAFNLTSPFKKINSISLSMSGNGWTNGAVIQVQQANIKETSTAANGTVTLVVPAIAFRKQSFSATNSGVTFTRAANVYIEDAPDSSVTGASGAGSTNTVTITNSYALYVDQGKSYFGGPIIAGGGGTGFAKNPGVGDIAFDNGSKDTPGSLYYWDNNKNFGTDVYFSGSGTTRYRIVKELNESGGAELWSIDRDGVVYRSNWAVGETVNTALYNYSDLGMSGTTTISSTSYTTIATISYTPKSSSSYLWIEFSATYNIAGGGGDDFWSNIEVGGAEQVNSNQIWTNGAGGGTRSGVLFPLSARYTNSGTSSLTITVRVKRGSSDDNATIYGNASSGYMRIQEVQR